MCWLRGVLGITLEGNNLFAHESVLTSLFLVFSASRPFPGQKFSQGRDKYRGEGARKKWGIDSILVLRREVKQSQHSRVEERAGSKTERLCRVGEGLAERR